MNDYFYLDSSNVQCGPVSPARFAELGVLPSTLVWCQGMAEWQPAETVDELKDFFRPAAHSYTTPPPPIGAEYQSHMQSEQQEMPPCPDNYMAWAILSTICCCLPFGIVAIVKASKVNSLYIGGYYDQAVLASMDARNWSLIAFVCGILSFSVSSVLALL